ncbi:hypothetical protein FPV67DRAFT_1420176, partial [Lyophyllum atratum]
DYPRTPRRTPMACQFCRGRKLKCDGLRPSCSNCNKRGYPCQYIPVYVWSHCPWPLFISRLQERTSELTFLPYKFASPSRDWMSVGTLQASKLDI